MGLILSKLFGQQEQQKQEQSKQQQKQQTKPTNKTDKRNQQQTKQPKQPNKELTEDEQVVLKLCAEGNVELSKIAEALTEEGVTLENALTWYIKSLDYVKCSNCTELIKRIEELYLNFVVIKLEEAIELSKKNRENNEKASMSYKVKLLSGQDKINNIITAVPESLGISTREERSKKVINNFELKRVDEEIDALNNIYITLNNILSQEYSNKQIQEVKKFFELVLVGTDTCIPEYYNRNSALNNPGNILISEILSLNGYKQLLRFAPLQPLLMFHDATNNPLLSNSKITDKFICDYLGIEKYKSTINESSTQIEIQDNEKTYIFKKSGNQIVGDKLSYKKEVSQNETPCFITKSGFVIDLGIYNNECHTMYYILNDTDTFEIIKVYEIDREKYILYCSTNTWTDTLGNEVSAEKSQYFNNQKTEKTFISQTNIYVHKIIKDKSTFTIEIDYEIKKGDVVNNASKQYLMNLLAYYFNVVFGNGGYNRKTFCKECGLESFMQEETKNYDEFFTKGTNILKNIWKKYPEHILSMCAYANKTLINKINFKLPVNYPRFGNSEIAASRYILNKIINYTSTTKDSYFDTVDFTEYPFSVEPWDIVNYPVSTSGTVYNFKIKNNLTKSYDNRFEFLFNQVGENEISEYLNITAKDIVNEIDLTEFEHKTDVWNIADVLNDQSLSMFIYSKFIVGALRWNLILPINTMNSTIFINKNDLNNGCPKKNLLAFLLTPRVENGKIVDELFN